MQLVERALKLYKKEALATSRTQAGPLLELTDGIKRIWNDRWVNIRKSGTEPVIRVFSEAPTASEAKTLCDDTLESLKVLMKQISL